jgi:hypothetical protein
LIKQTYVDASIAVVFLMLVWAWLEHDRRIGAQLAMTGAGFIIANLPFWLYFIGHHALNDYLIGAFLLNRYYVSLGPLEWVNALFEKIEFLSSTPVMMLISCVWLSGVLVAVANLGKLIAGIFSHPAARWVLVTTGGVCWALFAFAQVRGSSPGIGLFEWALLLAGLAAWMMAGFLFLRRGGYAAGAAGLQLAELKERLTKEKLHNPELFVLLIFGMVDFPLVVLSITLSGKDFTHYYISLFPAVFSLIAGALLAIVSSAAGQRWQKYLNVFLAAVLVVIASNAALQINAFLSNPGKGDERYQAAKYLESVTQADEPILVWGWEAVIYFLADRESPTRYAFQFPAYLPSPYQETVLATILADLQQRPPRYLADTLDGGMPLLEGRTGADCLTGSSVENEQLRAIIAFFCQNYDFDRKYGNIYLYRLRK